MFKVVLSLMLALPLSAQGQLSVTWNGSTITGPVLIYLDEILVDNYRTADIGDSNRPGALICRSEDRARVSWHFTNGLSVSDAPRNDARTFIQTRTGEGVTPSVSRFSLSREGVITTGNEANGLWHCRLNAVGVRDDHSNSGFDEQLNIGIFSKGGGRGSITSNQVSLTSSSFESNPPTFTLTGDTRGGPPTTYTWTRNGQVITDGGPYNISIAVNGHSETVYHQSHYRSTLTVTGHLPGLYQYSVTNRATTTTRTSSFRIEGGLPVNIAATQTGLETVLVTWTPPPVPPSGGYLITTSPGGGHVIATSSPYNISISSPGVYNITVQSLSHHLPSQAVEPVKIVMRGVFPPMLTLSVTATSVTVFWTQPPFSFTPVGYTVALTRVTGSGQVLCSSYMDSRAPIATLPTVTSLNLINLQEFSVYTVTVTATISVFGFPPTLRNSAMTVTSLSASPSEVTRNVTVNTTSRSATVSWTAIDCIDRNGVITGYEVEFQEQDGARIPGEVVNETFTASGLIPHTNYIFRVAGVNANGTGPFTNTFIITTDEEVPSPVSNFMAEPLLKSVLLSWSPPQEPNGVVIAYEVTYRNRCDLVVVNTTDVATSLTVTLTPSEEVVHVSVRAYTSVGPGEPSYLSVSTLSVASTTSSTRDISITVLLTFLFSLTLYTAVLLVGCVVLRKHYSIIKISDKKQTTQTAVYEEVDTAIKTTEMAMKENEAYQTVMS